MTTVEFLCYFAVHFFDCLQQIKIQHLFVMPSYLVLDLIGEQESIISEIYKFPDSCFRWNDNFA